MPTLIRIPFSSVIVWNPYRCSNFHSRLWPGHPLTQVARFSISFYAKQNWIGVTIAMIPHRVDVERVLFSSHGNSAVGVTHLFVMRLMGTANEEIAENRPARSTTRMQPHYSFSVWKYSRLHGSRAMARDKVVVDISVSKSNCSSCVDQMASISTSTNSLLLSRLMRQRYF